MAKAKKVTEGTEVVKASKKGVDTSIVTIKNLSDEFGLEARKLRIIIRGLGLKAPEVVGAVGFGPRAKYEWSADSKELAKIRKAIQMALAAKEEEDEEEAE